MTWLEDKIKEYKYDPYYNWCKFCLWAGEKYWIFRNWLRGNGTIRIRDISYEKAKEEITLYFEDHHDEKITTADLEENLNIDFWLCDQIREELACLGEIE